MCPVLGRGSCCPSVAVRHSFAWAEGAPPVLNSGPGTQRYTGTLLMSTPGPTEESQGCVTFLHPLPHLALLGRGAPAEGALLQLLRTAPVAGRELLQAATLQEAHLLGSAPLLQDLLLGLEL